MTESIPLVLANLLGFQSGLVASWRYYKSQRSEYAALERQHERERDLMENEIKHERRERRRLEDQLRSAPGRGRHADGRD